MNQDSLWLGHLDIGDKSSPVARDFQLETGKDDTVYLYNFMRNEIIEYKRNIVECKLRDLSQDEIKISMELKNAFDKAVKNFVPRGKPQIIPECAPPKPAPSQQPVDEQDVSIDISEDIDLLDDEDDMSDE